VDEAWPAWRGRGRKGRKEENSNPTPKITLLALSRVLELEIEVGNLQFLVASINFKDFKFNLSKITLRGSNAYVDVLCNEFRVKYVE